MRKQGTIARWDAARGFGFIRGQASGADVFFHLRDLRGGLQPREGSVVTFEEIHVGGKGPRAMAIEAVRAEQGLTSSPARSRAENRDTRRRRPQKPAAASASGSGVGFMLLISMAYGGLMIWAVWRALLPWWTLPASFGLNLLTFWMYWTDKRAAQTGRWRTPENTLQLLALAGGWPGAWLAQQVLRHKSSKPSFQAIYWLMVLLHGLLVWAWLFWPPLKTSVTGWL